VRELASLHCVAFGSAVFDPEAQTRRELTEVAMTANIMDEEIKKMLEKNLEYSQEIYKQTKYIKGYVFWAQIFGVLKILIIVVPIVIGIIYLPPLLNNLFDQYKDALGIQGGSSSTIQKLINGGAGSFNLNGLDAEKIKGLLNK